MKSIDRIMNYIFNRVEFSSFVALLLFSKYLAALSCFESQSCQLSVTKVFYSEKKASTTLRDVKRVADSSIFFLVLCKSKFVRIDSFFAVELIIFIENSKK